MLRVLKSNTANVEHSFSAIMYFCDTVIQTYLQIWDCTLNPLFFQILFQRLDFIIELDQSCLLTSVLSSSSFFLGGTMFVLCICSCYCFIDIDS